MKVVRFELAGRVRFGVHEVDGVRPLDDAPWFGGRPSEDVLIPHGVVKALAPVAPSKIVCVGRNFAEHAKELSNPVPSEPLIFLKPPSAVIGADEAIVRPADSERVEHEAELGVVIGRLARHVAPEAAWDFVFGFACCNDVTARDLQRRDVQFTRGKGFDTFCPVGPWIETELDPSDVGVQCRVNGVTRQSGRTRDMLFDIPTLVAWITRVMTLVPGDLILTGTPSGVGPLESGDTVEVEVDGLGVLANPVV
jgi:2-keto-4-pentenoate hydratase/2-oxohepta-3-ene-1,7-dioic acid hydratase in catechol pathway